MDESCIYGGILVNYDIALLPSRHGQQRIRRPWLKPENWILEYFYKSLQSFQPIDCAAIDNRRKFSDSISEGITDWRHAKDYVKLLPYNLHQISRISE